MSLKLLAPEANSIIIDRDSGINPYDRLLYAIGMVESNNNDRALNCLEMAYGRYQIRQVRLNDYYKQTGIRYNLTDMYDQTKAKEVFMWYAYRIGEDNPELIIRKWNGSGSKTYEYLRKVKKHLL